MERILVVGLGGQCTPRGRPHNPTTGLFALPRQQCTAGPFSHFTHDTLLSNPAHRQDYTVAKVHSADDDAVAWLTIRWLLNAYDSNNIATIAKKPQMRRQVWSCWVRPLSCSRPRFGGY